MAALTARVRRLLGSGRIPWLPAVLVLGMAGTLLELYFMREGAAIRGDSVRYVMGARNLLVGNGFSRLSGGWEVFPETGFAPLLSFVLAGFGWLGLEMIEAGRWMNAVLFGMSVALVGALLASVTRSGWIGVLGSVLVLTAPNVVEWHAWLMSESLFVFLLLVALACLLLHLASGRPGWLISAAVATGAASLARYPGVSLIPAGALGILLWGRGEMRSRLARAAAFAVLAALPFAAWMVRNAAVGGAGLANRAILYHPIAPEMLRVMLFEPTSWLIPRWIVLPRGLRGAIAGLVFVAGPAAVLLRRVWRRRRAGDPSPSLVEVSALVLSILVGSYVAVLVINSLLLDAGTTISGIHRYLTPLFVLLVLLDLTAYTSALGAIRWRPWAGTLGVVLAAVVILAGAVETARLIRGTARSFGFGGIREEWTGLAATLAALGPDQPILTDNPEMVYYLIDRPAYAMPIKFDPYRQEFRADYREQIELARSRLEAGGLLVVFGEPTDDEAEAILLIGAAPVADFSPDATVYSLGS